MTTSARRRRLLQLLAAAPFAGLSRLAKAIEAPATRRLLVLVELRGGNDGLNTVVPFADPAYRRLRPRLAIPAQDVLPVADGVGLHPALAPLLPAWSAGELAVVQGLGYPQPNLSHFRSIEIWETASRSDETLAQGWLARAFALSASPAGFAADGVGVGPGGLGPFSGGTRAIVLANPEQFLRNARLARPDGEGAGPALRHVLKVEREVAAAARRLEPGRRFDAAFPPGPFGAAVNTAAQLAVNPAPVAAVRLALNGFDTHANQAAVHAALLRQLGEGLTALRTALQEAGRWDDALVATYSEFGRRPRENESGGTDHGTVAPHFVLGGKVRGGLHGEAPDLERLDASGNPAAPVDFRRYYATFLARWWSQDPVPVLGAGQAPMDFV